MCENCIIVFLLITQVCGMPASWATRHTTVCLIFCTPVIVVDDGMFPVITVDTSPYLVVVLDGIAPQ